MNFLHTSANLPVKICKKGGKMSNYLIYLLIVWVITISECMKTAIFILKDSFSELMHTTKENLKEAIKISSYKYYKINLKK